MPSRAKNWAWTLNNYTEEDVNRLSVAHNEVQYLIFGREVAPDNGTPHLQGFVQLKRKLSLAAVKRILSQRAHVEVARNVPAAIEYCKKDDENFVEIGELSGGAGSRNDLEQFKDAVKGGLQSLREVREAHSEVYARHTRWCLEYMQDHAPAKELPNHELRPWQAELKTRLDGEADDRTIEFVVDTEGNQGKTWFAHWYANQCDDCQVIQPGKKADMAYCLDSTIRVLIMDAPRSKQGEFVQYDFLEDVKNGYVFSTKYESRVKQLQRCHVVVLMNEDPDLSKLSVDRYKITRLSTY